MKNTLKITLLISLLVFCSVSVYAETPLDSSKIIQKVAMQPNLPDSFIAFNAIGFMPFPEAVLFPHFQADPSYPRFKLLVTHTQYESLTYKENEPVGQLRILTSFGGKKSFFRIFPAKRPDLGLQLEIGFSFNAMVDAMRSTDFVGWDGVMHMSISARPFKWLALQAGRYHISSHRADEFLENSGGLFRRNYVRDSYGGAVMLLLSDEVRCYLKADEAFHQRPDEIRGFPWKVETGFEIDDIDFLNGVWSFAGDVQFFEYSNWEGSYNFQLSRYLGPAKKEGGVRVGLEYYIGRVPIADFFEQKESYISVGIWVDSPAVY
jgi:uncharacterized protein DUF1207